MSILFFLGFAESSKFLSILCWQFVFLTITLPNAWAKACRVVGREVRENSRIRPSLIHQNKHKEEEKERDNPFLIDLTLEWASMTWNYCSPSHLRWIYSKYAGGQYLLKLDSGEVGSWLDTCQLNIQCMNCLATFLFVFSMCRGKELEIMCSGKEQEIMHRGK